MQLEDSILLLKKMMCGCYDFDTKSETVHQMSTTSCCGKKLDLFKKLNMEKSNKEVAEPQKIKWRSWFWILENN